MTITGQILPDSVDTAFANTLVLTRPASYNILFAPGDVVVTAGAAGSNIDAESVLGDFVYGSFADNVESFVGYVGGNVSMFNTWFGDHFHDFVAGAAEIESSSFFDFTAGVVLEGINISGSSRFGLDVGFTPSVVGSARDAQINVGVTFGVDLDGDDLDVDINLLLGTALVRGDDNRVNVDGGEGRIIADGDDGQVDVENFTGDVLVFGRDGVVEAEDSQIGQLVLGEDGFLVTESTDIGDADLGEYTEAFIFGGSIQGNVKEGGDVRLFDGAQAILRYWGEGDLDLNDADAIAFMANGKLNVIGVEDGSHLDAAVDGFDRIRTASGAEYDAAFFGDGVTELPDGSVIALNVEDGFIFG